MQTIEPGIFYEDTYPGVTLGALSLPRGTILIDAPLRAEDGRAWRVAMLNQGGGMDRILISLDSHPDRTIGARSLECPVITQQSCAQVFRTRPLTFKSQGMEVGAEWETCTDLGSSRWAIPDITFSELLYIHWGTYDVRVEYHPGPAYGASWVVIPEARVAFIGDAVLVDQPPFLAEADLPAWIETLDHLLSPDYNAYTLISGRGGAVIGKDAHRLRAFLVEVDGILNELWDRNAPVEEAEKWVPKLIKHFKFPANRRDLYEQRLRFGLQRHLLRRYQPVEEFEVLEEDKLL
jgi:glyoxylase-like metal-dependent hydrolase (beta-lactamase superfamily II)